MSDNQPAQSKRDQTLIKHLTRVVLFLIPALIYLPTFGGDAAVPPGQSTYSDLLITHYPYLLYLRESIIINHQIPLWSTLIQSGAPFAANPLAGLFYLPGWLAMLFPLPQGLSLNVAAHAIFGTWGMYNFLRQKRVGEKGSVVGALGFGLMPKLAAHFGAGHITLIYAISWTPWLLFSGGRDKAGWKTGCIAGMLFLADPRWSLYGGALWLSHDIAHRHIRVLKDLTRYLKSSLIAVLISAPLILPLLEYIKLTSRSNLGAGDILTGSLPISNLISVIIPGAGGNTEWYFYSGGIILALFISQLFMKDQYKNNWFWTIWAGIGLLLSFGMRGISSDWIEKIPILNLLRVPARSLFLTEISLAIIAGSTVDRIFETGKKNSRLRKISFGLISLGILMVGGVIIITQAKPFMVIWGFLTFTAGGLILLLINESLSKRYLDWFLIGLLVIDLLFAGWTAFEIQNKEIREPTELQMLLMQDEDYFRIYSPSYSVAQHLAAEFDLELADGVDPMQIAAYVEFMEEASGVPQEGYSVTIPRFRTGNPAQDNVHAKLNGELLGLLNVKYVISEFEITGSDFTQISFEGNTRIYMNEKMMPRAWIENPEDLQTSSTPSGTEKVKILSKTPNRLLIDATGPGKLVISEICYPGWRAYIDGKQAEINPSYNVLRSVLLPEGDHQIVLTFQPISVYGGLILAGIGWAVLAFITFRERIEKISE